MNARFCRLSQRRRGQSGLTLIEVLISVLVLGLGLLGLALLQSTTLRMIQSSNQRTVATELAYDALDMVRAGGRSFVSLYNVTAGGVAVPAGCTMPVDLQPANVAAHWQCRVATELPGGSGAITLTTAGTGTAVITVTIAWTDAPWEANVADRTTTFIATSSL